MTLFISFVYKMLSFLQFLKSLWINAFNRCLGQGNVPNLVYVLDESVVEYEMLSYII